MMHNNGLCLQRWRGTFLVRSPAGTPCSQKLSFLASSWNQLNISSLFISQILICYTIFRSQAWMYCASMPFLVQGGSKIPTDLLHGWLLWGENAEGPIIQLAENLARGTAAQGLSVTGLLLQADKHPEVSRFQCVGMCQHCWLQQSAEMPESIKWNNLGTRTRTRVNSRTQCLMEHFIQGKTTFLSHEGGKIHFQPAMSGWY